MNRIPYRLAAGAALVVAAVTACGTTSSGTTSSGTTSSGTKPASPSFSASARAASNGVDKMSATQATRTALAALSAAHSVRVRGTFISAGRPGSFDLRLTQEGSSGSITSQGAAFETIIIGKNNMYLKGPAGSWKAVGLTQSEAALMADRWVKSGAASPEGMQAFSLTQIVAELTLHANAVHATITPATLGSQKVMLVSYPDGSKIYVACTGPAYPLRFTATGAEGGQCDFSEYGAGFHVTPPKDAVDLTQG